MSEYSTDNENETQRGRSETVRSHNSSLTDENTTEAQRIAYLVERLDLSPNPEGRAAFRRRNWDISDAELEAVLTYIAGWHGLENVPWVRHLMENSDNIDDEATSEGSDWWTELGDEEDEEQDSDGRLTRRGRSRPWRTLQEMYGIQARAFKRAMAIEARQELCIVQAMENAVVELTPDDGLRSFQELAGRFPAREFRYLDIDYWTDHLDRGNDPLPTENGLNVRSDDDMIRLFWTSETDLRLRPSLPPETRSRAALQNSVLALYDSQETITWCPCCTLMAPNPFEKEDSRQLRETFCSTSLQRRHWQKRLLDEVYIRQSRGLRIKTGLEAHLYSQYILAASRQRCIVNEWFSLQEDSGAGRSFNHKPERLEEFEAELHDLLADQPTDAGDGCSLSVEARHMELAIQRARFRAKGPRDLWPCFEDFRKP